MYRLSFPGELGDLLLTPQWPGLSPVARILTLTLVCLVPIGLMLWLYRYELRLVARSTALALLGLRLVVLTLLLFLICFQPVLAKDITTGLPGHVLVAVDRSESSDIADPQRSPADKLRFARALKLGGDVSDEQLETWAAAHDARKPLPKQEQKAHDAVCARVDAVTRTETARRVLGPDGVGLLPTLTSAHAVDLLGFNGETWDLKPDQLDELFKPTDAAGAAASSYTDLRKPLLRALERSGPGQGKVLGVVLITDGQHNDGESPSAKAAELGDRQIPIYPIALGARKPPPDAALLWVRTPPAVFKDVDLNVDVRFKIASMASQDFVVKLFAADDKNRELDRRVYRHNGIDVERTETFKIRFEQAGTRNLVASIEPANPASAAAKEARSDNNRRTVAVTVADDKAKVLLVDGEARWEFHYLAVALKRDRRMQLKTVVFNQPRLDANRSPEELQQMGSPQQHLPSGPDALAEFDCIILGDVSPDQLPLVDRIRLEKYVSDRGGTLVILAGKRYTPLAFPAGAQGEADPLRKLLPIENPHVLATPDGFNVRLTEEGKESTFLQLGAAAGKSESLWARLPRHFWSVVGTPKPAAVSLAGPDGLPPPGADAAADQDRATALIARQNYGLGRVLFVGLDSTWRWRFKVGDPYHHAFWGDAIHWAAADKALGAGNEFVHFGTNKPTYHKGDVSGGEKPKIVVRLNDEAGPIKADLLAGARIVKQSAQGEKDEPVALIALQPGAAGPRVLNGDIPNLPPGQYAVELVIPDLADKLKPTILPPGAPVSTDLNGSMRANFTVLPPESTELLELGTKWNLLEELAVKSGGRVFTPENASELAQLLAQQTTPHVEHHEQRLWQSWVVLALVLVLLTFEWVGRKWAGLP